MQANGNKEGWLDKLLHVRRIETGKDSHSKMLSDKDTVYEMQGKSTTQGPTFPGAYAPKFCCGPLDFSD